MPLCLTTHSFRTPGPICALFGKLHHRFVVATKYPYIIRIFPRIQFFEPTQP